jgi:hypothetical protein
MIRHPIPFPLAVPPAVILLAVLLAAADATATSSVEAEIDGGDAYESGRGMPAMANFERVAAATGLVTSRSDGYGGQGYFVSPIVSENPATVVLTHGLGGDGQEVCCANVLWDILADLQLKRKCTLNLVPLTLELSPPSLSALLGSGDISLSPSRTYLSTMSAGSFPPRQ